MSKKIVERGTSWNFDLYDSSLRIFTGSISAVKAQVFSTSGALTLEIRGGISASPG